MIEILAVVLIIIIVCGLTLAVARYVGVRVNSSQTQALIAQLEDGIGRFKLDKGFYPTTTIYRVSQLHAYERTNSWMLYTQLTSGPKKYVNLRSNQVVTLAGMPYLPDPWGNPIVYYRPTSNVVYQVSNASHWTNAVRDNYAVGGLVNSATYDLFSFGSDGKTFVPGANWYEPDSARISSSWTTTNTVNDNIGNCNR